MDTMDLARPHHLLWFVLIPQPVSSASRNMTSTGVQGAGRRSAEE
jgi:hypothetical protein